MNRLALLFAFWLAAAGAVLSADWSALHGDLQRTGFYREFPVGKLRLAWRKELWRELTGPRAEVIVGGGCAFMGTYAGRFYCWNATNGTERWVVETDGPIGHSPAFQNGVVFFGSMDRHLRAVTVATGREKWSFETEEGIWVSPVVHQGFVLFGDRAGKFYALSATNGRPAWTFQTGDRILTSASVSEDGARVLFASEDMHAYCLDVKTGRLIWKSRQLPGLTLRDYAPLIARGLAFFTTSPVKDFHAILGEHENLLVQWAGFKLGDRRYIPGTPADVSREQERIIQFLKGHPDEQTFHVFRVSDGGEPWIAPIFYTGGLHNPATPPCFNPLTGELFVQLRSAYGIWDGGGEVRSFTCFGKLDPATGRVALVPHGYPAKEPNRPPGAKDTPWGSFNYIGDETQTLSCAPGRLFCTHQGNLGLLDLASGKIENLFGRRDSYGGFYGAANFGWENQGGVEKARAAGRPYGLVNEWHGPARAIVSVANGRVYFPTGSQVLCLEVQR